MKNRVARIGMFVALAFVLSYIEAMIPFHVGIQGVKLGLANVVVMVALYCLGEKEAFGISMVRILLTGLTFGSVASMIYSLGGGLLSFGVMVLAKKTKKLSNTQVSVLGGIFHNVGQIIVAMIVLETKAFLYYLPVLLISGVVAGVVIGILGSIISGRIRKLVT